MLNLDRFSIVLIAPIRMMSLAQRFPYALLPTAYQFNIDR